ncbi:hypothetical protein FACS1894110_24050 [Spirochaetia bacterium]|nr:hypothetical protein FACS1894110_24050 [Spirochaetia bacterium]
MNIWDRKGSKILIIIVSVIIGIPILLYAFVDLSLGGLIFHFLNNKRDIGDPIVIETENLNGFEYVLRNTDYSFGKYHLFVSLEPKNIEELRKPHEPIVFRFDIEINQNGNSLVKEYEYEFDGATIGLGNFVIFEIPKDVKNGKNMNIIFKNISLDKNYYTEIKFFVSKRNFRFRET